MSAIKMFYEGRKKVVIIESKACQIKQQLNYENI